MTEPLDSYGLLGDTRTAALVSGSGSIDWLCVPRFDGDPVFGTLIDPDHGGRWALKPVKARVTRRAYTDRAVSIRTDWEAPSGTVSMTEGMISDASSRLIPRLTLVRQVRCESGTAEIELSYDPRLGLPGRAPSRVRRERSALVCSWGSVAIALTSDRTLEVQPGKPLSFPLRAGESATFVLGLAFREPLTLIRPGDAAELLAADDRWWRSWTEHFDNEGRHAEDIARSLITLRLLTYAPSGAPVAAPTTSLPAPPGSDQTWDYRFSWPRDASIGIDAFLAFGSRDESDAFMQWLVNASRITRPKLHVLYTLDGRPVRHERTLDDVSGYDGGKPVRIGNAAALQHQLDVYGWVLDAGWLSHRNGEPPAHSHWRALSATADLIAREWERPDNGIWEERGEPDHFVHSKLLAWIGLDRAIRLAESYPAKAVERWRAERGRLAEQIRERGYSERLGSYRRIFDRDELDAAVLVPVAEFDDDPRRVKSTIDAVRSGLGAGGPLLYRNLREDRPAEGAFLPCSFWLVQALARTGRLDEAESALDELCALSNPLGLYAEQVDPNTRQMMGNFPQAFSHATFLQAFAALNEARETSRGSSRRSRAPRARPPASARRS